MLHLDEALFLRLIECLPLDLLEGIRWRGALVPKSLQDFAFHLTRDL